MTRTEPAAMTMIERLEQLLPNASELRRRRHMVLQSLSADEMVVMCVILLEWLGVGRC
jgi:hypothetical protein